MTQTPTSLAQALSSYDRSLDKEEVDAAERERLEILRRFPLERWPDMGLEQYALGHAGAEDSFCRWMEFRTQRLGSIRGGSARKLLIYKHKEKPGWYYDPVYKDENDAWRNVREAFVAAFAKAKAGAWNEIDELVPLQSGPALRMKALYVYFPTETMPSYSERHVRHFLRQLGRAEADDRAMDVVRLNRALLDAVRGRPELDGWSPSEIQFFLYRWAHPHEQRRIVKIAPGELGKYWDDCHREGYICVGWDDVGDLREFESKDAFRARFDQEFATFHKNHKPTLTKKANELWTLMELEPGDLVVANRGTSRVLAVGEVIEPGYAWNPDRPEYRHTVRVKWNTEHAKDIPPQKKWALVTVSPVSAVLYETITGKDAPGTGPVTALDPELARIAEAIDRKGQVILYGPPGTGKTYHARRFAVAWLLQQEGRGEESSAALADAKGLVAAERGLCAEGLLAQLTFHPSYSYEDFVEGYRPQPTTNGTLSLHLVDGVFKRLCQAALAKPSQRFLLVIDEINRANLAKVFGELITVIERDKRGMEVTLPQSKDRLQVPPNLFLVGTMNTADRSIKLMDAALRRRFAFVECMPDLETLRGAKVGTLALDDFLEALNERIAKGVGREKQIGQSFLLEDGQPISSPEDLARCFRQEILPLLQEYCYDDYSGLSAYLGKKVVGALDQNASDAELVTALEEELCEPEASSA